MTALKLIAACSSIDAAQQIAEQTHGICMPSTKADTDHLPFAALAIAVTDTLDQVTAAADVGAYLVCERTIKNQSLDELDDSNLPLSVGIFTMVAHPKLGAGPSDAYWRDNHAPLALKVHVAMTHYYQMSVRHRFHGPDWNGFACCCFSSEDDLRNKFFDTPEGKQQIEQDVSRFADTRNSPRRVIASAKRY